MGLPVLVYDGDCAFCRACARWAARRLAGRATVVPARAADLPTLGLLPTDVASAVWWVGPGGRLAGHRAVARALVAMGGGWGLAGRAVGAPPLSWAAAVVYRAVARNRHRLSRWVRR